MFSGCNKLKTIYGLNKLNTGNVANMGSMFADCSSLQKIDFDKKLFNTSNVQDMSYMFKGLKLTSIDVSFFDTNQYILYNRIYSNSLEEFYKIYLL